VLFRENSFFRGFFTGAFSFSSTFDFVRVDSF
jgi:hypothetical protein